MSSIQKHIKPRAGSAGFTLLELVIAVVIISVLAALAIGNYTDYVMRSRRAEATVALMEMANLQTQFFANNLTYTTALASLPYPTASLEGHYVLSVPVGNATNFTVRADATGSQATQDTDCSWFQLSSFGVKTSESADCW